MKKTIAVIAIVTLVMILSIATAMAEDVAIPSISAPVAQGEVEGPKASGIAYVREEAHGMSEVLYTMQDGESFTLCEIEGDWALVEVGGVTGYVYRDEVTNVGFLPKVDTTGMSVTIFSNRRANMTEGETVTITSKLEGMDGYILTFQWQVDMGNGFQDIPGANNATYSYSASIETLNYGYRLVVYID